MRNAECTAGRYGDNCERKCDCGRNAASCDPVTGHCQCRPGYFGAQCKQSEWTTDVASCCVRPTRIVLLLLSPPRWTKWTVEEIRRLVVLSVVLCTRWLIISTCHTQPAGTVAPSCENCEKRLLVVNEIKLNLNCLKPISLMLYTKCCAVFNVVCVQFNCES